MKQFHLILLCIGLSSAVAGAALGAVAVPQGDIVEVVEANNAFAIDLYKHLDSRSSNLFFSPISMWADLALAYAGSRGRTATEIGAMLQTTLSRTHLHPALAALSHSLIVSGGSSHLALLDSLWLSDMYVCSDSLEQLLADDYGEVLRKTDFRNPEKARHAINSWVAAQTVNMINEVIPLGWIAPRSGMLLVNGIYFKGDWRLPFEEAETVEEDFHVTATRTIRTPLMGRTDNFGYADSSDFQVVVLPYRDGKTSMIAFLPKRIDGLHGLEAVVTLHDLQQWILKASQSTRRVRVEFPRFRVANELHLSGIMKAMGMRDAFDPTSADFSGIGAEPTFIADIIQEAFVDVSEQGTEAVAATAAGLYASDAAAPPGPLPQFRADHPFLLLIQDNNSGAILFLGRLNDPSS